MVRIVSADDRDGSSAEVPLSFWTRIVCELASAAPTVRDSQYVIMCRQETTIHTVDILVQGFSDMLFAVLDCDEADESSPILAPVSKQFSFSFKEHLLPQIRRLTAAITSTTYVIQGFGPSLRIQISPILHHSSRNSGSEAIEFAAKFRQRHFITSVFDGTWG